MLKLKYMFENYELAKQALSHWEHNEKNLEDYLKFFRISSNAVYPFEANGKRCFLRLSPEEEKQEMNLKGELEFLLYLQEKEYPSMVPAASKEGEFLLTLNTVWGTYYASVFEGVPGRAIEDTDCREEIIVSYGKALGRLHRMSMEYEPQYRKWNYKQALKWCKGVIEKYDAPMFMYIEAVNVEKELEQLPITKDTYGLVHYDFELDNVFYDEKSGDCHVIDFEDGMYHFFLLDIEQALDSLSSELSDEQFTQAKKLFLLSYASQKTLDPDFESYLPLMRRFCNIFSYARLIRCVAEDIPQATEWLYHLQKVLNKKIEMLEKSIWEKLQE